MSTHNFQWEAFLDGSFSNNGSFSGKDAIEDGVSFKRTLIDTVKDGKSWLIGVEMESNKLRAVFETCDGKWSTHGDWIYFPSSTAKMKDYENNYVMIRI